MPNQRIYFGVGPFGEKHLWNMLVGRQLVVMPSGWAVRDWPSLRHYMAFDFDDLPAWADEFYTFMDLIEVSTTRAKRVVTLEFESLLAAATHAAQFFAIREHHAFPKDVLSALALYLYKRNDL